ncbi:hypothetical protein [Acetivibrio saccincola]|uniref:hypothetical protein n=1 Tax=Acetivibrio saccincola TaxID=1677857 RepID=UPI0016A2E888|nr:hypothetical protein [Acetivibrio saccincola]NLW26706.1 hypothetical protein [Acetivibrio saccincola]HOA96992.1 hypothetical protein [Acetivibrio saccincola]HQD27694.1 hypothetical protein [Acetivibrio saccincola]
MKKIHMFFWILLMFWCLFFNFTYASKSNLYYNSNVFSFSVSEDAGFFLYGKEYTGSDNSITLVDKKGEFTLLITSDIINNQALNNMRQITGDNTSSNKEIFYKIFEYKISHFKALVEHSKNNFYFDSQVNPSSETYIKIFEEHNQILFGENSNIILFNTIEEDKQSFTEKTNINITIPSSLNMTIYSINITGKKGFLTGENINRISLLIQGLSIPNSTNTNDTLDVFKDKEAVKRANQGIYPNFDKTNVEFVEYKNQKHNYKIYHPSTSIPYLQNNIISNLDYVSFKINHNTHYSITAETLNPNHAYPADVYVIYKKGELKYLYNDKLTVLDSGKINISGEYYDFLKYKIEMDNDALYVTDVYIIQNLKLFTVSLNSYYKEASEAILNIFRKIVSSFEITNSDKIDVYNENVTFNVFTNNLNEYSFLYPAHWTITNKSKTMDSAAFYVSSREYSTTLDIFTGEFAPFPTHSQESLFKLIIEDASLDKYLKGYNIPYKGRPYKTLTTTFKKEGDAIFVNKLINYLDKRDRYRLACSSYIIYSNKVYSLFISINDFLAPGTDYTDNRLMYILDTIVQSFDIKRNEVFLEDSRVAFTKDTLRKVLCANALISHPSFLNLKNDILTHPAVLLFAEYPEIFSQIKYFLK